MGPRKRSFWPCWVYLSLLAVDAIDVRRGANARTLGAATHRSFSGWCSDSWRPRHGALDVFVPLTLSARQSFCWLARDVADVDDGILSLSGDPHGAPRPVDPDEHRMDFVEFVVSLPEPKNETCRLLLVYFGILAWTVILSGLLALLFACRPRPPQPITMLLVTTFVIAIIFYTTAQTFFVFYAIYHGFMQEALRGGPVDMSPDAKPWCRVVGEQSIIQGLCLFWTCIALFCFMQSLLRAVQQQQALRALDSHLARQGEQQNQHGRP